MLKGTAQIFSSILQIRSILETLLPILPSDTIISKRHRFFSLLLVPILVWSKEILLSFCEERIITLFVFFAADTIPPQNEMHFYFARNFGMAKYFTRSREITTTLIIAAKSAKQTQHIFSPRYRASHSSHFTGPTVGVPWFLRAGKRPGADNDAHFFARKCTNYHFGKNGSRVSEIDATAFSLQHILTMS